MLLLPPTTDEGTSEISELQINDLVKNHLGLKDGGYTTHIKSLLEGKPIWNTAQKDCSDKVPTEWQASKRKRTDVLGIKIRLIKSFCSAIFYEKCTQTFCKKMAEHCYAIFSDNGRCIRKWSGCSMMTACKSYWTYWPTPLWSGQICWRNYSVCTATNLAR